MDRQRANESIRVAPVVVTTQAPLAASRPAPDHAAPLFTLETYEKPDGWKRHPLTRVDVGIFLLLAAAAVLVRWPLILRGETLLQSDEAIVGLMAQDIAEGRALPIYFYGQRYMGALEAYVVAALLPLFGNPLHALRFGPACFFALLTGVQYLMLTRWFGRRGGLVGAAALLAASPMFVLWSISARGGYIEILLWGSGVIWAYSEWLVAPRPAAHHGRQRFLFGLLLGSGLWINPSIVLFVLPALAHALLHRPLALVEQSPTIGRKLRTFRGSFGRCSLPLLLVAAILAWNAIWAVSVEESQVRHHVLLDALPKPIAAGVLVAAAAVGGIALARRTNLLLRSRQLLQASGLLTVGLIVGAAPALAYIVQTTIGLRPLEPTLPLGFRFLWRIGDSTLQLWHGLPLLLGADPRPYLSLITVGRDPALTPLMPPLTGFAAGANWLILGALTTSGLVFAATYHRSLGRLLRLHAANHGPEVLLAGGAAVGLLLYVLNGASFNFTTVRYLVPLWAFIPGLLAAVCVSQRFRLAGGAAAVLACTAWAVGQFTLFQQIGRPHPLRAVADRLVAVGIDPACAEILDAHLLSYLSGQRCRVLEYEPFWPRLGHYAALTGADRPTDYLVSPTEPDRSWDWTRGGWPGSPPPEVDRLLWPRLRHAILVAPGEVSQRELLPGGYERIRLRRPLGCYGPAAR